MSWGTYFRSDIEIKRVVVNSTREALNEIEDILEKITEIESQIKLYTVSDLSIFINDQITHENIISYINHDVTDLIHELVNLNIKIYKLRLYIDKDFNDGVD